MIKAHALCLKEDGCIRPSPDRIRNTRIFTRPQKSYRDVQSQVIKTLLNVTRPKHDFMKANVATQCDLGGCAWPCISLPTQNKWGGYVVRKGP